MAKGKKGSTKAKKKNYAKLKKAGVPKDKAYKLASQASKGLDVTELAASAVSSIPFVGGLASNLIEQGATLAGSQGVSGRGGRRGVMLVDSTLGNLGTISRRKALSILVNRGRRPPRRSSKTVAVLRAGESIQVVK